MVTWWLHDNLSFSHRINFIKYLSVFQHILELLNFTTFSIENTHLSKLSSILNSSQIRFWATDHRFLSSLRPNNILHPLQ